MQVKKRSMLMSLVLVIVTVLGMFVFATLWPNAVAYDVCLALTGSAVVAFLLTCGEYMVEKRRAVRVYCDEVIRFIVQIGRVKYFNTSFYGDVPVSMLVACAKEDVENERLLQVGHSEKETVAKDIFIKYMESKGFIKKGLCTKCRSKEYKGWFDFFWQLASDCGESYIKFCRYAQEHKRALDCAFAEFDFILKPTKLHNLHTELSELLDSVPGFMLCYENQEQKTAQSLYNWLLAAKLVNAEWFKVDIMASGSSKSVEPYLQDRLLTMLREIMQSVKISEPIDGFLKGTMTVAITDKGVKNR